MYAYMHIACTHVAVVNTRFSCCFATFVCVSTFWFIIACLTAISAAISTWTANNCSFSLKNCNNLSYQTHIYWHFNKFFQFSTITLEHFSLLYNGITASESDLLSFKSTIVVLKGFRKLFVNISYTLPGWNTEFFFWEGQAYI